MRDKIERAVTAWSGDVALGKIERAVTACSCDVAFNYREQCKEGLVVNVANLFCGNSSLENRTK